MADFCLMAWRNIKLLHLSSFGPNLVVLLEAHVPTSPEGNLEGHIERTSFKLGPAFNKFSTSQQFMFGLPIPVHNSKQAPQPPPKEEMVSLPDYTQGSTTDESKVTDMSTVASEIQINSHFRFPIG